MNSSFKDETLQDAHAGNNIPESGNPEDSTRAASTAMPPVHNQETVRRSDATAQALRTMQGIAEALRCRAEADNDPLSHLLYEALDDQLRILDS